MSLTEIAGFCICYRFEVLDTSENLPYAYHIFIDATNYLKIGSAVPSRYQTISDQGKN
jgi:hypothetical protein